MSENRIAYTGIQEYANCIEDLRRLGAEKNARHELGLVDNEGRVQYSNLEDHYFPTHPRLDVRRPLGQSPELITQDFHRTTPYDQHYSAVHAHRPVPGEFHQWSERVLPTTNTGHDHEVTKVQVVEVQHGETRRMLPLVTIVHPL